MMILAKVRVTARDVDDDKVLRETTVYVAPADRRRVEPVLAIVIARQRFPELDSSAVRFQVTTLASVKIPRKNRLNVLERVKLAAFLGDSVPTAHSGWLDETVHDLAAAEASRANNGGLESQLDYLCRQLGTEGLLRLLQASLTDEED